MNQMDDEFLNNALDGVLERERVLAVYREIFSNQDKYQAQEYIAFISRIITEAFKGKIDYIRQFDSLEELFKQDAIDANKATVVFNNIIKTATTSLEHNGQWYLIRKLSKNYLIGKTTEKFHAENLLHLIFCFIDKLDLIEAENKRHLNNLVEALSSALESRDNYTLGHSKNVASYAYAIALSYYDLFYDANKASFSPAWRSLNKGEFADRIRIAGLLHDIGKVGMDDFLKSPDRPNDDQFNRLKTHIRDSMEIISRIDEYDRIEITKIANQHHEKWDGGGYIGLKETNIHIGARIMAVADSFDAMTTDRAYRDKLSWCYAVDDLRTNSMLKKQWYDPDVYFAFEDSMIKDMANDPTQRCYQLISDTDTAFTDLLKFRNGVNADCAKPDKYREAYDKYDNSIKCYNLPLGNYIRCSHKTEKILCSLDQEKMKSVALIKKIDDVGLLKNFIDGLGQASSSDGKTVGYFGEHLAIVTKDEYKELYNVVCKTNKTLNPKITAVIFKANADDIRNASNCLETGKLKDGQICCLGPLCIGDRDNCLH